MRKNFSWVNKRKNTEIKEACTTCGFKTNSVFNSALIKINAYKRGDVENINFTANEIKVLYVLKQIIEKREEIENML